MHRRLGGEQVRQQQRAPDRLAAVATGIRVLTSTITVPTAMDCTARASTTRRCPRAAPPSMPLVTAAAAPARSPATIASSAAPGTRASAGRRPSPAGDAGERERLAVDDAREAATVSGCGR